MIVAHYYYFKIVPNSFFNYSHINYYKKLNTKTNKQKNFKKLF